MQRLLLDGSAGVQERQPCTAARAKREPDAAAEAQGLEQPATDAIDLVTNCCDPIHMHQLRH